MGFAWNFDESWTLVDVWNAEATLDRIGIRYASRIQSNAFPYMIFDDDYEIYGLWNACPLIFSGIQLELRR